MKKHIKTILLVMVVICINLGLFFHQRYSEGIHDFYMSKFYNIDSMAYIYDEENREVTGTAHLVLDGTINKMIQGFKGKVNIEGYSIPEVYDISYQNQLTSILLSEDKNYGSIIYDGLYFLTTIDESNPWDVKSDTKVYRSNIMYNVYFLDDSVLIQVYEINKEQLDKDEDTSFEAEIDGEIIMVEGYTGGGPLDLKCVLIYTKNIDKIDMVYEDYLKHFVY